MESVDKIKLRVLNRLDRINQQLGALTQRYRRTFVFFISLYAIMGYAFVILFPVLFIISINQLIEITLAGGTINWLSTSIWTLTILVTGQVSYRMIVTKPIPAVGFTMPKSKVPQLYNLVEKLRLHFKRPSIARIIVSSHYELDIVKTPKWMLPIWSSNTLVIGLPLLICLNPIQFEHMLARKMGQFSKRHNPVTNWLYQLNAIWKQYIDIYAKQTSIESLILKYFFKAYSAVYEKLTVNVAVLDELNADNYAMERYSHIEICKMISIDMACRWFLENRYWPALDKAASTSPPKQLNPYRKLSDVIKNTFRDENLPKFKQLIIHTEHTNARLPSLKIRLENIGHNKPVLKSMTSESAAEFYLENSLNGALNLMDKLWLKKQKKEIKTKSRFKNLLKPIFKIKGGGGN